MIVLAAAIALSGCGPALRLPQRASPTPTLAPSATATPQPTPTPTPAPAEHLDRARRALFNGDWEAARESFLAAAQAPDAGVRGEAQLGLGDTQLRAGRTAEAIADLTAFLEGFPEHARRADGFLLRARAHQAAGLDEAALADYDACLAAGAGPLESFVHEQAGDALRRLGRPAEAVGRYAAAIAAPHMPGDLTLEVKLGRAQLEAGDAAAALAQFEALFQASSDGAFRASMNLLAGLALEELGDRAGAHARYLDSVQNYPTAYDAYSGLVRLVNAGVPVDEYLRGLIDYHARAYTPALAAFDRAIAAAPSGSAFYYRGLTRRALGDPAGARDDLLRAAAYRDDPRWADAWLERARTEWAFLDQLPTAIETYLAFVAAAPESPAAPNALFSAARLAERGGDLAGAAALWLRIPTEYPSSALASLGAFEAGIVRVRAGDPEAARTAFVLAQNLAQTPARRAAALLWIGKTHAAQGDAAAAQTQWQAAAQADPTGYYSVRAEDLLAGRGPLEAGGLFDVNTDLESERAEAEAWLRSRLGVAGPDPLSALGPTLAADGRWQRGQAFMRLGLEDLGKAEIEALQREVENDAEATYRLMHAMLDLGLYRPAIFAARQILRLAGMDDAATMGAPVYFNRIRFGLYFGELILPEAARHGLDGLLLLSLVRQESLFEGFATSSASARGLMQVIPSTGEWIAGQLGWPEGYREADLHRPLVSVRFGAFYLAAQRDSFGGSLYPALAAYNAGPGNSAAWLRLAPDDPDLFLEVIRFEETHLYLTRISEIFAIYRRLYVAAE